VQVREQVGYDVTSFETTERTNGRVLNGRVRGSGALHEDGNVLRRGRALLFRFEDGDPLRQARDEDESGIDAGGGRLCG
jgi:hypothetical protein